MKKPDSQLDTYLSHRRALVDYATPILGCRSQAEDVVQDAYLRVMPDDQPSSRQHGVAYLYRVVRNLAIDFIRRSAMESRHQDVNMVDWLEPGGDVDPETLNAQRDELERVAKALAQLPEQDRIAIEMHRLGGYTLSDIADRLGVSIATTHRMIRHGVVTIARALDENQHPE